MAQAVLAGRWEGDGTPGNPFRPRLNVDFVLAAFEDITGQDALELPPEPNVYIIIAEMSDAVLTSIRAATGVIVLWDDSQNEDEALTGPQRAGIVTRLSNLGYDADRVRDELPAGSTRKEAIRMLVQLFKRARRAVSLERAQERRRL
jgi:hypothetical protein